MQGKYEQKQIPIISNREIAPGCFLMELEWGSAFRAEPGQFLHVRCAGDNYPLLRRPLSIHRLRGSSQLEIFYQVVGRGTAILSGRKAGESLDVIGPLGNHFRIEKEVERQVLVAGGMGVAPLVFLADRMRGRRGTRHAFLGAKTRDLLLEEERIASLGFEMHLATEDGSAGFRGLVSEALAEWLGEREERTALYACGPFAMLAAVARLAGQRGIPCQVSLENFMGCGVGACRGCAVEVKGDKPHYLRVCRDGPVFLAGQIVWE